MRLVTWNVNSLKARLERVSDWIIEAQPDILCLQETKMKQDAFPTDHFANLGYESVHFGTGQWNGVAILSRVGLENPIRGFSAQELAQDEEARIVSATCGGIRVVSVYVPNGRSLDDDHYKYKLEWMNRLLHSISGQHSSKDKIAICGDFNIAPDDIDVYDPKALVGMTHVSEPERNSLKQLMEWGFKDSFRKFYSSDRLYSWWDYRGGSFHKGIGMRIDLILVSLGLTDSCLGSLIDRNARKGQQPSDHAPVVVELDE